MPLPKGIYSNPAVRQAWIEERQPIVAEYERLVAAGLSTRKAAKQVGSTASGIHAIKASLERMGGATCTGRTKSARIDLGLALLSIVNPPGPDRQELSAEEIAEWCGCSRSAIWRIEQKALEKVRRQINALLRGQVIHGDFAEEAGTAVLRSLHPLAAAA